MSDLKFQPRRNAPTGAAAPTPAARPATAPAQQRGAPASPSTADPGAVPAGSSGRVRHDERGNAVWEWVTTTTKNAILSATSLIRKLDSSGLSLEETQADKEKAAMLPQKRPGGGFNPYEQANKPRGKK